MPDLAQGNRRTGNQLVEGLQNEDQLGATPWPLNTSARRIAVAVAIVELVNHVKMKSVKSTTQGGTQPCTKAWVEQVLLHECGP